MSGNVRNRRFKGPQASKPVNSSKMTAKIGAGQSWKTAPLKVMISVLGFLCVALFCFVILVPSPIDPVLYELPTPPSLEGGYLPSLKGSLSDAIHLFEGMIVGPESIALHGKHLYTGTADGRVLQIDTETLEIVDLPKLGKDPCGGAEFEASCGRPLGMRIRHGFLYVMDASLGLFKYDLGNIKNKAAHLVGGVTFGNDLVISKSGLIYYTDSSQKWPRKDFLRLMLESSQDGLLLQFNETTGEKTILSETLSFANGVELSPNEDYLLVCETNRARISRYWLMGPLKGTWDYFITNLPGVPDNIRITPRGTYWLPFASLRTHEMPSILDKFGNWPLVRSFMAKLVTYYPTLAFQLFTHYGLVLELDVNGKILRSLHDANGTSISTVSEVEENSEGVLYLGSFGMPFLSRKNFSRQLGY